MLFSPAAERNRQPILSVLRDWLTPPLRVLELGSGSGQHARFFCSQLAGLHWQTSERYDALADLRQALQETPTDLAEGAALPEPMELDVTRPETWPPGTWPPQTWPPGASPHGAWDAVFSANTCHILPETALPPLLAGSRAALRPGGLLLLYGPFHDRGVHTAESNVAFDAHLRSLDPTMGVRDAAELLERARDLDLEPVADVAMPSENRMLILRAT